MWISREIHARIKRKRNARCGERCAAGRAPGCAPRPLHYYSHSRGAPTRALVDGRPIASPRNVLGHGQRLSRLAAAAGPPLHRLTLNSTHRTQSQNTAPDATHGHGLLRLGHSTRGFYQAANPVLALCAKDHTNQPTVSGPECAKCGTSQPASWAGQGPARVAHGSKISSLRVFNT